MRLLLFVYFFLLIGLANAQSWKGTIKDVSGEPIPFASIYFQGASTGTVSTLEGEFTITQKEKNRNQLIFHHIGFEDVTLNLKNLDPSDSIHVILPAATTLLKEAVIRAERERKIAGDKNEHVVDFTCLSKDSLVLIVKRKEQRWLQLFVNEEKTMEMQIPPNCNQLATDFRGKMYIQSTQPEYYYVVLEKKLLQKLPPEQFETTILPVVADLGPKLYFGHTRKLDQEYTLISFDTLLAKYKEEYKVFDEEQYKTNADWMQRIVSRYNMITPPELNVIQNGTWDGDLIRLIYMQDRVLFEMVSWYKQVIGRPISIGFTQSADSAYLWDFLNGKKITLGPDTAITKEEPQLLSDQFKKEVYLDAATEIHYGRYYINRKTTLKSLTPGDDTFFTFEEMPSDRKVEIVNNKCYFIDFKQGSQFAKLFVTSAQGTQPSITN